MLRTKQQVEYKKVLIIFCNSSLLAALQKVIAELPKPYRMLLIY